MNFPTLRRKSRQGRTLVSLGALSGAALLAGCGGSGTTSPNTAQIRAVNAVSNGGSGTISVNGAVVSGSQDSFGASSYQSLGSAASSVTFSLSANSGASYPALTTNFLIGNYYSLILVGRADIATATDPRYPSVIVTSDRFSTTSPGQAELRVIHAAPDAGSVDIRVNGAAAVSGAAYKSVSADIAAPSGAVTLQVNQAGSALILVTPQTVSLTAGHVYTVYVLEPTVSATPVYGIDETDDTDTATSSSSSGTVSSEIR